MSEDQEKSRNVFVVHGRNENARDALFQLLRAIDLRPLEWSEAVGLTRKPAPYVGEILDAAFYHAIAVVVLLTGDDEARLSDRFINSNDSEQEKKLTPQARPNVLFEAGLAFARHQDRTVLIQLGDIRPFTDVAGVHILRMDGGTTKQRQQLAQRLKTAGCAVNTEGTDWHTAGDFSVLHSLATAHAQRKQKAGDDPTLSSNNASNRPSIVQNLPRADGIETLFSRDPCVSIPAMRQMLTDGSAPIREIMERMKAGLGTVSQIVVRKIFEKFPQESGELLADRVLIDAKKGWQPAATVAECLSKAHSPYCADRFGKALKEGSGEKYFGPLCVKALGHLGAFDWGYPIQETLNRAKGNSDVADRYAKVAIEALARIFALAQNCHELAPSANELERAVATFFSLGRSNYDDFEKAICPALYHCKPPHADHAIRQWLNSDSAHLRFLGARILGQVRLSRALRHLFGRLDQEAEPEVMKAVAQAVGNIGGVEAGKKLMLVAKKLGYGFESTIYRGLALCAQDIVESEFKEVRFVQSSDFRCFVYRAMGLHRATRFLPALRSELQDADSSVRGQAALALARIEGIQASDVLRRAFEEASTPFERVFTALAVLKTCEKTQSKVALARLRQDLMDEMFPYRNRLMQEDVISTLRECQSDEASLIADSWEPIYAEFPGY